MTRLARLGSIAALLAGAACAHAPASSAARAEVRWPEPPEVPRVRLERMVPDPAAPAQPRSVWRRAWEAIAGLDPTAQAVALVRPFGVAAGRDGTVYVADPDAAAVFRLGPAGALEPVTCRDRPWDSPMALAVDDDGALWVADAGAGVAVRRAPDGSCTALGAGALERPTGIATAAGRVFVADPPRHQVVVFAPAGTEIARLGGRGEADGQLAFPSAVALAPDGSLLVVDALNFRIARFGPGGEWRGSFGRPGDTGDELSRPKGVAAGPDGRVYVTDAQRDLVLVFRPDGAFDYAFGASGASPGHLVHPAGVAVASGRVWVADSQNHRVQAFELLGDRS